MTIIAVAISGGVDSLVAAFLLKREGHEVTGVHFRTGFEDQGAVNQPPPSQLKDMADIGRQLKMPVEVLDLSQPFHEEVVAYFASAYQSGRTPNPCLVCNPTIKFGYILKHVRRKGAAALATGHYARLKKAPSGRWRLFRGIDSRKDQSYFLSRLTQDQLKGARFPLGELTKDEVRAIARQNRLVPATKKESQDICFIKQMPYHEFLKRQTGFQPREGPIEDTQGRVLGRHRGLHLFTVGQRRGINCPAAEPYYVVRLDYERDCLIVGHRQELAQRTCTVEDVNWIHRPERFPASVTAQIRYRHQGAPAHVTHVDPGTVELVFDHPQNAVTPGQGAVFYRDREVLGGGWIA